MIKIGKEPFSLPSIATNIFMGLDCEGSRQQVIFLAKPIKINELRLDIKSHKRYSAECDFYPVLDSVDTIVGSFFNVSRRRLFYTDSKLLVSSPHGFGNMAPLQIQGVGGVFAYSDEYNNILVIPSQPTVTDLVVLE